MSKAKEDLTSEHGRLCNSSHIKKVLSSHTNLPCRIFINHNLHLSHHPYQVLFAHFRRGTKSITKKPSSLNMIKCSLLFGKQTI